MLLAELNTFDERLQKKNVYLVSLGALEQHGRYVPIGNDNFTQDALLAKVQKELPDVIYLPTIPVGPSWQHLGFKGTVSLQPTTLYAMIRDIVDSLKDDAILIIFVSWHGGNKPTVQEFIEKEADTYVGVRLAQITFGDEGTDEKAKALVGGPLDDHAGNTEVSISLAVRPDITTQPRRDDSKQPISFEWDKRIIKVQQDGEIDNYDTWVASPEIGAKLLDIYSQNLVAKIKDLMAE